MKKRAKTRKGRKGRVRKGLVSTPETFRNIEEFKKRFYPKSATTEGPDGTNDNNFGADLANASLKRHSPNV